MKIIRWAYKFNVICHRMILIDSSKTNNLIHITSNYIKLKEKNSHFCEFFLLVAEIGLEPTTLRV